MALIDYSNKTLTNDGADLLANDDKDGNKTVIDKMVISDQLPNSSEQLADVSLDDFHNPKYTDINDYKSQGATFQPEAFFSNDEHAGIYLKDDYKIQMIGLLAHEENDNDSDETVLAVAVSNGEPYPIPASTNIAFRFWISLTLTYSNAENVTAKVSPVGLVTQDELNQQLNVENINVDKKLNQFETSLANSMAGVANSLQSTVNSLNSNVGSNVSAQMSKATSELNSIMPKIKMLEGQTPATPQLEATMDIQTGIINFNITQPAKKDAQDVYQYDIYYKKTTDNNYQSFTSHENVGNIEGLDAKSKYDVYVVAENAAGNSDKSNVVETQLVDMSILGVHSDNIQDPQLERTDGAKGLVAGINGAENDFDNKPVYQFQRISEDGNEMIRIPKCSIYKDFSNGQVTIKVSKVPHGPGWYTPKCFRNHPYVDVAAYDASDNGSGGLASQSGTSPLVYTDINDFRSKARNTGQGYQLIDIHVVDLIQSLYTVEFATLNSQSIMYGYNQSSNQNTVNNGTTDGLPGSSSTASNGVMVYRGIENLYGNIGQWIDGINLQNGHIYVCDNPDQYQSDIFTYPYNLLNYDTPESGGSNGKWISSNGYDPAHPEAQLPLTLNGTSSTFYCDWDDYASNDNTVACWGTDDWDIGDNAGLWFWDLNDGSCSTYGCIGSRLVKE